ncbi:MAG: alpha-N-methyltransferase NTM1 [Piptocephalis tieghemiana]|nr:MAG: alpha-N-methyltransferase NTM1 [Piptocephalis tieghemiana]
MPQDTLTQDEAFEVTATWYSDAENYWKNVPPTDDGMLGGFSILTGPDVKGSQDFLSTVIPKEHAAQLSACDCGAGIGRVSKHFLLPYFSKVDLVEQNAQYLETARAETLAKEVKEGRAVQFIPQGLQAFQPEKDRYDVIWCQWVLSHLTDEDLVNFLKRCKSSLRQEGYICVKENTLRTGTYKVDEEDSSVTRSDEVFKNIFSRAGLTLRKEEVQRGFPQELFPVRMYVMGKKRG